MEFRFENLLFDVSGLEKPRGMIQSGKEYYPGEADLQERINKALNVKFDEAYVIRYNSSGLFSYGGIGKLHRGKNKKVIAITKTEEGYYFFVKEADIIASSAKTGSWSIGISERNGRKSVPDEKQLNACIVAELGII